MEPYSAPAISSTAGGPHHHTALTLSFSSIKSDFALTGLKVPFSSKYSASAPASLAYFFLKFTQQTLNELLLWNLWSQTVGILILTLTY